MVRFSALDLMDEPTTVQGNYQIDSVDYGYRQYRFWIPF